MTLRTTFTAALAAAAIMLGVPVLAQDDSPATATVTPSEIAAADVTDAQVEAFVKALSALEEVRKEYTPRLQAAEDDATRAALSEEANTAALAAVDEIEGLTAADYLGIGKAASGDKALNDRILAELARQEQPAE